MLLQRHTSRVCRKQLKNRAHNSQAQRVFKTAPLYAVTNPDATATPSVLAAFTVFFESLWSPYGTKHYAIQSDHLNTPRRLVQSGSVGLGVSILSYGGGVQFGIISDATLCPYPQNIVDEFEPEFAKLSIVTLMLPWGEILIKIINICYINNS